MYTDKDLELARDIAREQYTDAPDDPHWDDDPYDNYCLRHADEDEEDCDNRSDYERYPLDSSYYEDARFL